MNIHTNTYKYLDQQTKVMNGVGGNVMKLLTVNCCIIYEYLDKNCV